MKLTIKEMKKIAQDILDKELDNETNATIVTIGEYYRNILTNKKYRLKFKMHNILTPIKCNGYYNRGNNTIFVFLNYLNRKKIRICKPNIFNLCEICYHELRHAQQKKFNLFSYEYFFTMLETYLLEENYSRYERAHDLVFFEIGANIYGTVKAKEYIKKNYPEEYEHYKNYIEKLEYKRTFMYMTYNAPEVFENYIEESKINSKFGVKPIDTSIKKSNEYIINDFDGLKMILSVFLKKNWEYKSIKEITENELFPKIDKKIIYIILSSKSFLKQLDIKDLLPEELELLEKSLNYIKAVYYNQNQYIEKQKKKKKTFHKN